MRKAPIAIAALLTCLTVGCYHNVPQNTCNNCSVHGNRPRLGLQSGWPQPVARLPHGTMNEQFAGPPGPPTGTYAYPYYTVRAPRDFLLDNPPSIGP